MTPYDERRLKKAVAALGRVTTTRRGDWLSLSCPLAPWTHTKGTDCNPSAGVSITPKGRLLFFCFSCTPEAQLLEMMFYRYERLAGRRVPSAYLSLLDRSNGAPTEAVAFSPPPLLENQNPPWERRSFPKRYLKGFPLLTKHTNPHTKRIKQWLTQIRGISEPVIEKMKLRYWRRTPDFVAFPMTLRNGRTSVLSLRSIVDKKCFRVSHNMLLPPAEPEDIPKPSKSGAWFGLQHVRGNLPLIICEGEIDQMRLVTLGAPNVVASGGTAVSRTQLAQLVTPELWVGFDADQSGEIASKKLRKIIGKSCPVYRLDWSVVGCKDPGELKNRDMMNDVFKQRTLMP